MDNELIVSSIKQLCKSNNITVTQLEKEVGMSQGLVSKWKDKVPSLDKVIDIADYFHVTLDEVVGYNQNVDDEFLNKLYNETSKGNIKWISYKKALDLKYQIKKYNMYSDGQKIYDEDIYSETNYIFKFDSGYVIMYSFYERSKLLKPKFLYLFIQPSENSDLIEQDYEYNDLLKLWTKILNSLGEDMPDEVKVEDFKNNFLNNKFSYKVVNNNYLNKRPQSYIKKIINEIVNNTGSLLYDIENNEIIYINEADGVTYTGKRFYFNYKEEMGQIYQAQMIDGDKLILISYSHIMKLSGFSCGEKCGLTGYNGLIEILSDVGFDISDKSIFNRENFVMFKK